MKQFDMIYQEYAKIVYGFLLHQCHQKELAEDLTQETFLIAYKKIKTYNPHVKMSTWLCGIAKKLWYKELEKRKHITEESDIPYVDTMEWESVRILKCVHQLEEPYKEVVYLRISANLSFAQIGEIMNKNENWARVTFYRGKTKIKELIEHEDSMSRGH